jgi:hypothetical protein
VSSLRIKKEKPGGAMSYDAPDAEKDVQASPPAPNKIKQAYHMLPIQPGIGSFLILIHANIIRKSSTQFFLRKPMIITPRYGAKALHSIREKTYILLRRVVAAKQL